MLVVVGHCVTHTMRPDGPAAMMRAECRPTSSDLDSEAGCIASLACDGGPRVVFIDGALSECFRLRPEANKSRRVEMLEMRRVQTADRRSVMGNGAGVWYTVGARTIGDTRGFTVHV